MSWPVICTALAAGASASLIYLRYRSGPRYDAQWIQRADEELHPLLKNHTKFRSYTTKHASYPSIRTFYHPHSHKDKLEAISDLPVLVFIHGLGGVLPQFAPLLGSFVNLAPCFAIELPGHGRSKFAPREYGAYTIEASAALWKTTIEDVCAEYGHRKVVLICHSMGCSIAALLTSTSSKASRLSVEVAGVVAICPKATPPTPSEASTFRRLLHLPNFVFDILRWFDGRGYENSNSVNRFVGEAAGLDLRRLQFRWNKQFRTAVWKRYVVGLLPRFDSKGKPCGGLPGTETWAGLKVPLFLIAGEADIVTKPKEVEDIVSAIVERSHEKSSNDSTRSPSKQAGPLPVKPQQPISEDNSSKDRQTDQVQASDAVYGLAHADIEIKPSSTSPNSVIKTVILPSPASHALMYDHNTYRTVAGLIEDFLSSHISPHLSLGWQLQQLTTSGKWDVKNLAKWKKVLPVSNAIAASPANPNGLFRALKTLREQDEEHTPAVFLSGWKDKIFAIIDISHDAPVYDTKAIEQGGVQYHKFPTVSKIPPTVVEVHEFINLVDRLLAERDKQFSNDDKKSAPGPGAIGVHCHYGYNRTGFFICAYLVEKLNYRVPDAIEEFARAKPPGIRHDHFLDTLSVRYAVGLKKAPTITNLENIRKKADNKKRNKKKEERGGGDKEDDDDDDDA